MAQAIGSAAETANFVRSPLQDVLSAQPAVLIGCGACYIETHDHDAYAGHFRLQLIEFTPTRLVFEIARAKDKYVEVAYDLDAKKFGEVQRIIQIVFGVQG
jgi:hypothetical protein